MNMLKIWISFAFTISHLTTNFNEFQQGQASLKRLREIEREPYEQEDIPEPEVLSITKGKITLKNVHFSYIPGKEILAGFSLNINQGTVVALVGLLSCFAAAPGFLDLRCDNL